MTVIRATEIPAPRAEPQPAALQPADARLRPVDALPAPSEGQEAAQRIERRARWEHFLEPVEDEPAGEQATRRACDRCGKPLPVGEPVVAVRLAAGGYAIQDQWCGRGRRLWRRRR